MNVPNISNTSDTSDIEPLLWELVDGTIDAGDRAAVEAYIAEHAETRVQLERIRAMSGLLAKVPSVEPPPSLLPGIERALASQRPPRRLRAAAWRTALSELAAPRWPVRLAWAAVGLTVGAGVVSLMLSDLGRVAGKDETKFYGAMQPPTKEEGAKGLALGVPPSLGGLTVRREDGRLTFDLTVQEATHGATLELTGDGMELVGFSEAGASVSTLRTAAGRVTATVGGGRIQIKVGPGSGGFVGVRLVAGGATVLDRTIANEEVPGR